MAELPLNITISEVSLYMCSNQVVLVSLKRPMSLRISPADIPVGGKIGHGGSLAGAGTLSRHG
jgi:hypothetical protein